MRYKDVLTGERVVSFIVFVNPPLVFSEYLQPVVELLLAVGSVILCGKRLIVIFVVENNSFFVFVFFFFVSRKHRFYSSKQKKKKFDQRLQPSLPEPSTI